MNSGCTPDRSVEEAARDPSSLFHFCPADFGGDQIVDGAVSAGGGILEVLRGVARGRCLAPEALRLPRVGAIVDVNRIMRARSRSWVSRNYGIRNGLDESG